MLFSCKISNSILNYLEGRREDITPLLECTNLSEEFLRDPSSWMKAAEMEFFLHTALNIYSLPENATETDLISHIGSQSLELRSWGVLDSVLKMIEKPFDIFQQPKRLISYFVSPEPPIEIQTTERLTTQFLVPISSEQYPLVTSYLQSAFSVIPVYSGHPRAKVIWKGIQIFVSLEKDEVREVSEIVNVLPENLLKDLQIDETLRAEGFIGNGFCMDESAKTQLYQNLAKLGDYMVRAQQLITLLIAQDRMKPSVKSAMKRVKWEQVREQFPATIQQCREIVEKGKSISSLESEAPDVFQEGIPDVRNN